MFLKRCGRNSQPKHRSSRPEVFCKKGVLRSFAKFTGKHLCQGLFFNKVAGLKETLAQVFSGKFWEISKNIFSYTKPPVAASILLYFYVIFYKTMSFICNI